MIGCIDAGKCDISFLVTRTACGKVGTELILTAIYVIAVAVCIVVFTDEGHFAIVVSACYHMVWLEAVFATIRIVRIAVGILVFTVEIWAIWIAGFDVVCRLDDARMVAVEGAGKTGDTANATIADCSGFADVILRDGLFALFIVSINGTLATVGIVVGEVDFAPIAVRAITIAIA